MSPTYLWHLWHAFYTVFDGMVGKPYVSAFQNFFGIENLLNIKEVMSKNLSDNNNAAMLLMAHVGDIGDVKYLNKRSKATLYRTMLLMSEISKISQFCIVFDPLLRYFTSLTSLTWIQYIRLHCQRCQRFCTHIAHSGFLVIWLELGQFVIQRNNSM